MVGGVINGALVTVGQAGGERVREGKKKKKIPTLIGMSGGSGSNVIVVVVIGAMNVDLGRL